LLIQEVNINIIFISQIMF